MENHSEIEPWKFNAGVVIGLLAALTILFSQSFYYSLSSVQEKVAVAKKTSGDQEKEIKVSSSNDLLSTIAQLSITQTDFSIIEIQLNDYVDFSSLRPEIPDFNTFFRTLFRRIISPNAP
ncbi:hypothetical protein [Fulvivirga sedimenti]|uniref:Uncharacterized protein n=1 Tax=Fulvivirga sedimenti TaxID=2879465 RepID=A0A9X1HTQ8_9BACT|nr:hypothetical protein [Fulvivirga sedimenti]MCA6078133.1 hypothetical protein [Fulvivirga sedimenti]